MTTHTTQLTGVTSWFKHDDVWIEVPVLTKIEIDGGTVRHDIQVFGNVIQVDHSLLRDEEPEWTVTLENDGDMDSPSSEDGWKLYSFCSRHSNFADPYEMGLGDPDKTTGVPKITKPGLRSKYKAGLAFILSYYEHGGCVWSLLGEGSSDRFDSTRVAGLLIWEQPPKDLGPKTYEDRKKDARAFLETYTAWANGNAYSFTVYDEDENEVEGGTGGWLDAHGALEEMLEEISDIVGDHKVTFNGEADWLMDHHTLPIRENVVVEFKSDFNKNLKDRLWAALNRQHNSLTTFAYDHPGSAKISLTYRIFTKHLESFKAKVALLPEFVRFVI